MIRAVLCGYYGQGNGGDEALLASLLQMLPSHVVPVVLSGNPQQTRDRYGVDAVPRKSAFQVLQALRQADVFIWGGGSLMQDSTSALNPVYYGGLMGLAQSMGLRTIAWAQGVGPLRRSTSIWITRQAMRGCRAISVRDQQSAEILANWGVPFWLAPDPVWALEAEPLPGLWDLPAPRVAVCLRSHPWLTPDRLELIAQALVDFQQATQTCLLLVPFQPVQDTAIAEFIQAKLKGPSKILPVEQPRQLKGVFRGVEMTIGMRFHALVMAAAEGCRCVGLSYDPKVTQLLRSLKLTGWDLNPNSPTQTSSLKTNQDDWQLPPLPRTATDLSQAWIEFYANGNPLTNDQIQSLVDRALMHQDLLKEALHV